MQAADLFFAPSVAVFADSLHLSPDVAGATLLAFGNAAPDIFTQIAAIVASSNVRACNHLATVMLVVMHAIPPWGRRLMRKVALSAATGAALA